MSEPNEILERFLADYCPKPDLIKPLAQKHWVVGEKRGGDFLLRSGQTATSSWLIIRGHVEIKLDGALVTERRSGDFIGEQAYLQRTIGRPSRAVPQADIEAKGE